MNDATGRYLFVGSRSREEVARRIGDLPLSQVATEGLPIEYRDFNETIAGMHHVRDLAPHRACEDREAGIRETYSLFFILEISDSPMAVTTILVAWIHDLLLHGRLDLYEEYSILCDKIPKLDWTLSRDEYVCDIELMVLGHIMATPAFSEEFPSQNCYSNVLQDHRITTYRMCEALAKHLRAQERTERYDDDGEVWDKLR